MSTKKNYKKEIKRELPIGERQRQYAIAAAIRNKDIFNSVKEQLDAKSLESAGPYFSLVWVALVDYYNKFNDVPTLEIFKAELENRLNLLPDDIDPEQLTAIDEFIDSVFLLDSSEININIAIKYFSKILTEQSQAALLNDIQTGLVSNYPELLAEHAQKAEAANFITTGEIPEPFPTDPEQMPAIVLEPTGVSFLDVFMNGGMARREVNAFCGPFGSCKTSLGIQLAVEGARIAIKNWKDNGSKNKPARVYFFSWEEDLQLLRPRILSYAAYIRRDSLEGDNFIAKLSRSKLETLKDYEKQFYREQIRAGIVVGEYERMQNAMSELNLNLRIIDFSGYDPNYIDAAGRLAEGVAWVIKRDQQMSGNPGVDLVVLDYAGAAVERAIGNGFIRREEMRHHLGHFPLSVKTAVASPFNCKVWCLHQLNTAANARDAGIAPKSTDIAEARNFFENVSFGFMVSQPTLEGLVVLTNKKQRRAARRSDIVVRIRGEVSRVEDASNTYTIEDDGIVDRNTLGQIVKDVDTSNSIFNQRNDLRDIGL